MTNAPTDADFVLRISGDSMEPKYHNCKIVYCHQQETIEGGKVGIFVLNSKGYCKRF